MAKAIDADRLLKMMSHWKPYMDMDKVRKAVQNMPTLTPPNEWVVRYRNLEVEPVNSYTFKIIGVTWIFNRRSKR